MTYQEALNVLKSGGCVYRPHWPAGTYLRIGGIAEHRQIMICIKNRPVGLWVGELADLSAKDWEAEIFVSLKQAAAE